MISVKRFSPAGPPALVCAALLAAGCSSSSSVTPAHPGMTPTPGVSAPITGSGRGVLQLALSQLATDGVYAQFVRPGRGLLLGAIPSSALPACDSSSATASQALPNQTGTQTVVTVVTYPAGDTTCSKSPSRILVMLYDTSGATPERGFGYQIAWAGPSDPVAPPGFVSGFELVDAAIYRAADGSANIDLRLDERGTLGSPLGYPPPPAQPAPGTFPATFPTGLIAPFVPVGFSPSQYIAIVESGSTSATGIASDYGAFDAGNGRVAVLATLDAPAFTATAGSGTTTLAWSSAAGAPVFAYDTSGIGGVQLIVPQSSFPLAAGALGWSLTASASTTVRSSAANFPSATTGSVTYTADGTLVACTDTYVDAVNRVQAAISCKPDGSARIVLTDLITNKPLTSPATIVLDAAGSSQPFTFAFDGTTDTIVQFSD